MRITGWSIDGFGLFHDAQVTDLPDGLTVVCGPNEAGKSTTLAFIRGVLFGFPTGNTKEKKYPPVNGGQHGGRLFLTNGEGPWTIERTAGPGATLTITLPDGSTGTTSDLSRLMAHADKEIFRNIFAFDLGDLDLRSLDSDAVKDRIFASAQTGAGVPPSQARKLLITQMDKLLKPRATSARINGLKSELHEIERRIREAQKAADGYPRAVAERDKLGAGVDELRQAQAEAEAEVDRLEKLESLWPDWFRAKQAEEELVEIDAPDEIPEDVVERLAEADAAVREAKRAIQTIEHERAGLEKRRGRITLDDRLIEVESESEVLYAGVSAYEESMKQLSTLEIEAKAEGKKLDDELASMGSGWNRERAASFDASIPTANDVAAWADRIRTAESTNAEAARLLGEATQRVEEARNERSRLETEITDHGELPSGSALDELESGASKLKALIIDRGAAEARVESAELQLASSQALQGSGAVTPGTPKSTRVALYGFAVLLAAAGGVMGIMGESIAAVALAVAAAGAGILGYRAGHANEPATSLAVDSPGTGAHVRTPSELLETHQSALRRISEEIGALASSLGVPDAPTSLEVEELAKNLARQRSQREILDRLSADFDRAVGRERVVEADAQEAETGLAAAEAKVDATTVAWDSWRTGAGVSEPMTPDTTTALLQAVRACRHSIARLEQIEGQVTALHRSTASFEQRADAALEGAGRKAGARGSGLAAALATLHSDVVADQKRRSDKQGLDTAIEGTDRQLKATAAERDEAQQRRTAVLDEFSVADGAELRDLALRVKRRQALAQRIGDCMERVDTALGLGPSAEEMRQELSSGRVDEWKAQKLDNQERVRVLSEQRDDAVRTHQDAVKEVARIAESSDVAQFETAAEGLREEIADAARRWQTLAIASALIGETVTLFEKKNQGPVVDRASALFRKISAGHYTRLYAHDGTLDAEDDTGKRIGVGDLSTAAAQQVYLCLRLGLAEEEARKRTSLPLIMDEVLVNFDAERALGVTAALHDVAQRHQVLMFTCHRQTVELLQETCGDIRVVELDRFVGTPH